MDSDLPDMDQRVIEKVEFQLKIFTRLFITQETKRKKGLCNTTKYIFSAG